MMHGVATNFERLHVRVSLQLLYGNPYKTLKTTVLGSKKCPFDRSEKIFRLKIIFQQKKMDHLGRSEIFPGIDCAHLDIPKIIYGTRKFKMSFYFVLYTPMRPVGG